MSNLIQAFLILILISCFTTSCEKDKVTASSAAIWQGFHHEWRYNHRVNRMGDWLDDVSYKDGYFANAYHSAASGIGPDRNFYKTYLTSFKCSSKISFADATKEIILTGEEETIDSQSFTITVDLPKTNDAKAIVLLNGFDIYARAPGSENLLGDGASDKLFNLSIVPSNVQITSGDKSTQVTFDVDVSLGGACASPECSAGPNNDFFDYFMTCKFQVILGEASVLSNTSKSLNSNYSWERPMNGNSNEIRPEDFIFYDAAITGVPGYNIGFLGIKSFKFQTEKGFGGFNGQSYEYPHMLGFNMALKNQNYDEGSGKIIFDADVFFKNWRNPVPIFSFGAGGSVDFSVDAELIQINDEKASLRSFVIEKEIDWFTNIFNPAPPNSDDAINYTDITIL